MPAFFKKFSHIESKLSALVLEARQPDLVKGKNKEGLLRNFVRMAQRVEAHPRQLWRLTAQGYLEIANNGFVLEIDPSSVSKRKGSGTELRMCLLNPASPYQRWSLTSEGQLVCAAAGGAALTIKSNDRTERAKVWLSPPKVGSLAQRWELTKGREAATLLQNMMRKRAASKLIAARREEAKNAEFLLTFYGKEVSSSGAAIAEVSKSEVWGKKKLELEGALREAQDAEAEERAQAAADNIWRAGAAVKDISDERTTMKTMTAPAADIP
jgi:hypothetical protein